MFTISKQIEIAGSHQLCLSYDSPCARVHGHNWEILIELCSEVLNQDGMVFDFAKISSIVKELDHQHLNSLLSFNPTAENIAHWLAMRINDEITKYNKYNPDEICLIPAHVSKVIVQESKGNKAEWTA